MISFFKFLCNIAFIVFVFIATPVVLFCSLVDRIKLLRNEKGS